MSLLAAPEPLAAPVIDTHTHADHFSATRQLAQKLGVPIVMHRGSPAPFVDMRIGDPSKAKSKLGWQPKVRLPELVKMMVDADLERGSRRRGEALEET